MRGVPFGRGTGANLGQIANLKKQISELKTELSAFKAAVKLNLSRLSQECKQRDELQAHCTELERKVTSLQQLLGGEKLPFLAAHVANVGRNYPTEMIPIFLAMAQCGEGIWNLFVEHMGFPCWRTIQRWRHDALENLGLSEELMNGSPENLDRIFKKYFGDNYRQEKRRVVLAVDAAGVSPHVVVHKDGSVEGLVNSEYTVTPEIAQSLRISLDALRQFVNDANEAIIKDFFVVLVCPLETENGGFPILLHPKQNGSADQQFVQGLVQLVRGVCDCGVDVVGLAFDGDAGYLQFVRNITAHFATPNFQVPLSCQNVPSMLMFEDLLHLAKCIRYRFVCGSKLCPFPHKNDVVSISDFEKIGIVSWVLDSSPMRKMDDFLPLMMFNCDNLARALKEQMFGTCIALLPISLALQAVMDSNLTRQERLDYLSTAWAFFWCYKLAYKASYREDLHQTAERKKGCNERMLIYDEITLDKGLSLFYSLSRVIADQRPVHLGALGTHWLEHFFGSIRRLCNRNDCPANFKRCMFVLMMQKMLMGKEKVQGNRKRLSDSGAILPRAESVCLPSLPLGGFVFEATVALGLEKRRFPEPVHAIFQQCSQLPNRCRQGQHLLVSMIGKPGVQRECGSTVSSRMTNVAGQTTRKKDILAGQISKP